jgi:hypothetical protein
LRGRLLRFGGDDVGGEVDEFSKGEGEFGFEVLAVLHLGEVMLEIDEYAVEFLFVCLLPDVEFDDSALKDGDEVDYEVVVGLLLLPCCEARVY